MSYIGRKPTVGNFQICDAISVVNGQAAYTMQVGSVNVIPQSANHMIVSLNGTIQKPNSSFTVSGSTITFSSNLVTNDVIDFIQILGDVLDLGVPSDATVTSAKIVDDSVTLAKMASGTDGNIISYDASGNPVAVATGTSGHVLTSAGAGAVPSFQASAVGGKILQVVHFQRNGTTTVSSGSFVTTNITKAITPSASNSKILVLVNGVFSMNVSRATVFSGVSLRRTIGGTTSILQGDGNNDFLCNNVFGASNMQMVGNYAISDLDSPNTTSETTYEIFARIETSGEAIVYNYGSMGSVMTLMEVGA